MNERTEKQSNDNTIYLGFEGYSDGDVIIVENSSSVRAGKLASRHLSLTIKKNQRKNKKSVDKVLAINDLNAQR